MFFLFCTSSCSFLQPLLLLFLPIVGCIASSQYLLPRASHIYLPTYLPTYPHIAPLQLIRSISLNTFLTLASCLYFPKLQHVVQLTSLILFPLPNWCLPCSVSPPKEEACPSLPTYPPDLSVIYAEPPANCTTYTVLHGSPNRLQYF